MRSKFLSLIFCIIAFGLTMVFVVNIIDPAASSVSPDTSGKLTIEDETTPMSPETLPQNTTPVVEQLVSEETVKTVASDVEKLFERLAYSSDKSYAEDFAKLSQRLDACAEFLRDKKQDPSGSAYFTVISEMLKDVTATPFVDNSSFSVRMSGILKNIDASFPASAAPQGTAYPKLDTSVNGELSLAMLSVYRQQTVKENSFTVSVGGSFIMADSASDLESSFDTKYSASDKNYPLYGISPLISTDDLSVINLQNVFTENNVSNTLLTAIKGKPAYAAALKNSGVDLAVLSGAHLKDYGDVGLEDTKNALAQNGVSAVTFSSSLVKDTPAGKVAILTYDVSGAKAALVDAPKKDIAQAKSEGAVSVIVVLCSSTTDAEPNAVDGIQTKTARSAIDNGADLVVNYSQSVIQAIDSYKDRYIVYSPAVLYASCDKSSLDNSQSFIFQQSFTLENGKIVPSKLSVSPINNGSADGTEPKLLLDESAEQVIDTIAKYSSNTKYTKYGINKANIDYICIKK